MTIARNLTFAQGETVDIDVDVSIDGASPDLTGYSANAAFRKHHESANSTAFTTTLYANGTMNLSVANSAAVEPGTYVYSVNVTNSGTDVVTKVQSGLLVVEASII